MSVVGTMTDIPAEHKKNVCGQFDEYLKKIERTLRVTMAGHDGALRIIGPEDTIQRARSVFSGLMEFSKRGNTIAQQNADYVLSLSFPEKDRRILETDKDIIRRATDDKSVKPKTMGQKHYVDSTRKKMIVLGIGPIGAGKTYLVMAMVIQAFRDREVNRTILTRPAIEAGRKLGLLPGDLQGKTDPYLRPLYDALYQIMGAGSYPHNSEEGLIEVAPLVCMRGRTLNNVYIILDEVRNTTPAQVKMFLTRIDFGSRVIVTGDQTQKDSSEGVTSGLDMAVRVLKRVDDIEFCYLTSSDVVYHPPVWKIVQAYGGYEMRAKRNTDKGGRS